MSGLTLSEIRDALADQIADYLGDGTNVRAYPVDCPPPSVLIEFDSGDAIDYFLTFGSSGLAEVRFSLVLQVGGSDPVSAGRRLDDYLSVGTGNGRSLIDAVMSNRTLGLTGCDVVVTSCEPDSQSITARVGVTVHISKQGAAV